MSAIRTDIHRPSAINPEEYELIALMTVREDSLEDMFQLANERAAFVSHLESTGGRFSQHEQSEGAGQCQVCGAHCIDYAIFYHASTNTYIKTGFDCASKLEMGDERRFRDFRKARKSAEELIKGKHKAYATLEENELLDAWDMYEQLARRFDYAESLDLDQYGFEQVVNAYEVAADLVDKLVKYGSLSNPQWKLLGAMVSKARNARDNYEKRQAERAQSESVPQGKAPVTGEVISAKQKDTPFGVQTKMMVRDDRGFKVFGTAPNSILQQIRTTEDGIVTIDLDNLKGKRVSFNANLKPSDDDETFGFFSRPSKAKLIEE